MKKVAIIESVDEFESFKFFLDKNALELSDFEIVALGYELQVYFRKNHLLYKDTLVYFDSESQKSCLLKFEQIFNHIEEVFDFIDDYGLKKVYCREIQHYTEFVFNHIAQVLSILEQIYKNSPILELYVCDDTLMTDSVWVTDDRLLSLLVDQFARSKKIKSIKWTSQNLRPQRPSQINGRRSFIYSALVKFFIIYAKALKKEIIVLPTKDYGFQPLIDEISRRNSRVIFLTFYDSSQDRARKYLGIAFGIISKHFRINLNFLDSDPYERPDFIPYLETIFRPKSDIFDIYGVDFSQIMFTKATNSLNTHLHQVQSWVVKLSNIFEGLNIKLIISPFGRGIWAVAPVLGKKYDIPSLFISHGSHPVPSTKFHHLSIFNLCLGFMLGEYSHVALSTPVQEAHLLYYKQRYPWIHNEEIKTGPLIFAKTGVPARSKIRKIYGLDPDELVLLHAASLKWKGGERFFFLETMDEYLSALSDVVDSVNHLENCKLIIRIHPGFDLKEDDLRLFLPESENLIFSDSGSFSDVLSAADMLVSYSSTCIDEALLNKVPVLLYDKWDRYNHFQTGVFSGDDSPDIFPVCYVNSVTKLSEAFKFMNHQIKLGNIKNVDISRYKYGQDYSENFYKFVAEHVNKEVTNEDSRPDPGKLIAR